MLSRLYVLDPLSSAGYCLRCWQAVRNECILGMRPDSFEWITSKLGVRTYQRLAKTLGFPAQQRRFEKKKVKKKSHHISCRCTMTDDKQINVVQGTPPLRRCERCAFPLPDLTRSRSWLLRCDLRVWHVGGFGPVDEFFCGRGGGGGCDDRGDDCCGRGGV